MTILIFIFEFISLFLVAFIAGSTAYISLVEVPARAALGHPVSPTSWREFFPRAANVLKNTGLVMLPFLIIAFLLTFNWFWIGSVLCCFVIGPYTGAKMAPINNQLQDQSLDMNTREAQDLAIEWGKRHLIRTYLGLGALVFAILAALT
jgi:hypothetical protein